jgi:hypothetical protein
MARIKLFKGTARKDSRHAVLDQTQTWEATDGFEPATRVELAATEDENTLLVGARQEGASQRDRHTFERESVLNECLEAWRFNPLARRIVELTTQYAAGGGVQIRCEHAETKAFLEAFWQNRLNRMDTRLGEFSDELARSGNLFVLISTDASGMSYVRSVPASMVTRIESRVYDVEQETRYYLRGAWDEEEQSYPAFNADEEHAQGGGDFTPVMLHYAVNRPAGAQWGDPDLAPILRWLARYNAWLEDRVRLNRFRNAFLYVVKARFVSEQARARRQSQLGANPPSSGSILVTDESEEWSVISPKLEALDASTDGMAIKKMIAAGAGVPLHFLAEPESSTRTTAESAGGPTFRRFEERQRFLCWVMADVLKAVAARRARVDGSVDLNVEIRARGGDISARDNAELARAGVDAMRCASELSALGVIDKEEVRRLTYKFLGEQAE